MIRRTFALAAVLFMMFGGVAAAQYNATATGTVSDTTPAPGQPITLTCDGFDPGTTCTFTLFSTPVALGTATVQANRQGSLTTKIPDGTAPGRHTIRIQGTDNGQTRTVDLAITVVAPQAAAVNTPAGRGNLSRTGTSSTIPMTRIGVVLVALGGLVLLSVRKRNAALAERNKVDVDA